MKREFNSSVSRFATEFGIRPEGAFLRILKGAYKELGTQAHNPTRLIYPSGRSYTANALMPSVREMAIIDRIPFFLDTNETSKAIKNTLNLKPSHYVSFENLINSSPITDIQFEILMKNLHRKIGIEKEELIIGHKTDVANSGSPQPNRDAYLDILANLLVIGADPKSIKIGAFAHDYRIKFSIDGVEKTLIYREQTLPDSWSDFSLRRNDQFFSWIRNCFGKRSIGTTAVIAKGDWSYTAPFIIELTNPDVVIADQFAALAIQDRSLPYDLQPYTGFAPEIGWGHSKFSEIKIGQRIKI